MAEQADQLSGGELERFLAWCKSEAKRTETARNQLLAVQNQHVTIQTERLGLDVGALTVVALKLERMRAGSAL